MAGMRIDLDLGSEDNYTRPFDAMLRKLDQLENRWRGAMGNMASSSRGIPAGGSPGGAGNALTPPMPGAGAVKAPPSVDDLARLYKIQNKVSGGKFDDAAKMFAQQAYDFHQQAYQSSGDPKHLAGMNRWASSVQQPGSFMDKLKDVFSTSRIGADGNLMPLVGKLSSALGISSMAFGIATTAVSLFASTLNMAREHTQRYTNLMLTGGGTMPSGFAVGAGAALGADPSDLVRKIQNGIGSGGYGASYAASLGVNPMGGPFGDINYAKKAQTIISDIMNSKSMESAIRKSEMVGAPELAQLQNLSPLTKALIQLKQNPMTQGDSQQMQEFNTQWGLFMENLKTLGTKVLTPVLIQLNGVLTAVNLLTDSWTWFVNKIKEFIVDVLNRIPGIHIDINSNKSELKKNTEAIHGLRRSIEGRETLGGGERARNAIPSGVNGFNLGDAVYRHALNTGVL